MGSRRIFGSIRRLPSGRYQARYIGPDEREHKPGTTFDARRDAEAWLAVEWSKLQSGAWGPPEVIQAEQVARVSTLLGEYAEEVIARRVANGRNRETTAAQNRRYLRLYLAPFASRPLNAITARDVSRWYASLAKTPDSRANAYGFLASVMNEATRDDLIDKTPCRIASGAVKRSARTTEDEVLTTAQFAEYITAAPEKYRVALKLAFWCGLRSGEVRGLRRCDIDLNAGELTIAQQVVKLNGQNVVQHDLKTYAGRRVVAIPPHLLPELRAWLATVAVLGREALLFQSPTGQPMSGEALRAAGKKAARAIGRPSLRVHSLRHSSATLAAQSGATTAEMMGRFGWSSLAMVARYSHAMRERDRELAAKLSVMI